MAIRLSGLERLAMSNPFEMVHINAERDKEAKRQALRNRDNKITVVDFGKRDNGYLRSYPIEDEVQAISKCAGFRTYLTASENMIAQAERDTLSHVSRKGFPNRATYEKEICYSRYKWTFKSFYRQYNEHI